MTKTEFWKVLATIQGFHVRSYDRLVRTLAAVCPVSAVCNKMCSTNYKCAIEEPARDLDLDQSFAYDVARAADSPMEKYRKKLLRTLKLMETI